MVLSHRVEARAARRRVPAAEVDVADDALADEVGHFSSAALAALCMLSATVRAS